MKSHPSTTSARLSPTSVFLASVSLLALFACSEDKPLQHAENIRPEVRSVTAAPRLPER